MSTSRAALTLLLKIQDGVLKARGAELRALEDRKGALEQTQAELRRKRQTEASVTDFAALPYLPQFLAALEHEQAGLARACAQLDADIDAKRDEVYRSFSDKRVTETVDHKIAAAEAQRRKEAEARTQDDQSIILRGWRHARVE